jgi:hypothetical protein
LEESPHKSLTFIPLKKYRLNFQMEMNNE